MEGNRRVIPYYDVCEKVGRDTAEGLRQAEVYFVAATHSKGDDYKLFRKSAVEFIEKHSIWTFGFDALIPYLAMTYVDRFHLNSEIPNERNLDYTAQEVSNMELHICRQLGWQIRTLTPFCFLDFFVPFLRLPPGSPSPLRYVRQLIVKSQFDIAFTEFRPSVLAAAAMLTVYQQMFPNRYGDFYTQVIIMSSPHMDDVLKCQRMLVPLYKDPSVPAAATPKRAPGESSSSVVRKRSDPIPVPGEETPIPFPRDEKEIMEMDRFLGSLPVGANLVEELRRYEREKQAKQALEEKERSCGAEEEPPIEEERIQREGKQHAAASDEIHPETEERLGLVEDDLGELMDFKLGWIEAQAEADKRGDVPVERDAGSGSGAQDDTRGDIVPAGTGSGAGDVPGGGTAGSGARDDRRGDIVPAGTGRAAQANRRGQVQAGRDKRIGACLGHKCCDIL